jgi:hypothetical protein
MLLDQVSFAFRDWYLRIRVRYVPVGQEGHTDEFSGASF